MRFCQHRNDDDSGSGQHNDNGSGRKHNDKGSHDNKGGGIGKGFRTNYSCRFFGTASACSGCGGRIHG